MTLKQQLEQVIANLHEHADQLNQLASDLNATSVWHKAKDIEEIVIPRLSAIMGQMGAEPVAILHDDGHYTFCKPAPEKSHYAGWCMEVYAAPQVPDGMVQLDAARSTAAIVWGWLWHVTTADDRVKTARQLLGQMLDKDLKRYGIQTAKDEGARGERAGNRGRDAAQ